MILIIFLKYYLIIIYILVLKVSNDKDWTEECYSIVTLIDDHIIFVCETLFLIEEAKEYSFSPICSVYIQWIYWHYLINSLSVTWEMEHYKRIIILYCLGVM